MMKPILHSLVWPSIAGFLILLCFSCSDNCRDKTELVTRHSVINGASFEDYSNNHPMRLKYEHFCKWVLDCAYENRVPVYDYLYENELTPEDVLNILVHVDTSVQISILTGRDTMLIVVDSVTSDRIHEMRFEEVWTIHKDPIQWTKTIKNYAPVDLLISEQGRVKGTLPLFKLIPEGKDESEIIWEEEMVYNLHLDKCRSRSKRLYNPADFIFAINDAAMAGELTIVDSSGREIGPKTFDSYLTKENTYSTTSILTGRDTIIRVSTSFDYLRSETIGIAEHWTLHASGCLEKEVQAISFFPPAHNGFDQDNGYPEKPFFSFLLR